MAQYLAEVKVISFYSLSLNTFGGRVPDHYPPHNSRSNGWDTPYEEGTLKGVGYGKNQRQGDSQWESTADSCSGGIDSGSRSGFFPGNPETYHFGQVREC